MTPQAPALHPLGVGELLDAAIYIYRKNWLTLIGIAAVMAVPTMLVQYVVAIFDPRFNQPVGGAFSPICDCTKMMDLGTLAFYYLVYNATSALLGSIAVVIPVGAFAFAVSQRSMGRRVTVGGAYRYALRRWISLLFSAILIQLSILIVLIPFVAFLFLIDNSELLSNETPLLVVALLVLIPCYVPLIFPSVPWSLTTPAMVLENLGPLGGMRRSWRLVGKSFWRTCAVLLVAGLLVHLLTYSVFLAGQYRASLLPNSVFLRTVVTSAGGLVTGAVIQPLAYVVVTLLYYDLRVRHEGYDLQVALEQLRQPATAVSTKAPA